MSGGFQKTYEILAGPAPESFSAYERSITAAYATVLDSDPDEVTLQRFFERNPSMVPGMRSLGILPSAFPNHNLLISQPVLPALAARIPDFLWIAYTSVGIYPTALEIERPGKQIFTTAGIPTADFTQARHQLAQWRGWFAEPENQALFRREYGVVDAADGSNIMEPKFILLYGRRAELEERKDLRRERALLLEGDVESLVSYDRLHPDPALANAITVKPTGHGRFRAVTIPPTFTLGPRDAARLLIIDGLDEVIENSAEIPPERRSFLLGRLPYWTRWAKENPRPTLSSTDFE